MTLLFLPSTLHVEIPTLDMRKSFFFYTTELGICELGGERFYGPGPDRIDLMLSQRRLHLRVSANPAFQLVLRQSVNVDSENRVVVSFETRCVHDLHSAFIRKSFESGARVDNDVLVTPVGDMFSIWDPSGNEISMISRL